MKTAKMKMYAGLICTAIITLVLITGGGLGWYTIINSTGTTEFASLFWCGFVLIVLMVGFAIFLAVCFLAEPIRAWLNKPIMDRLALVKMDVGEGLTTQDEILEQLRELVSQIEFRQGHRPNRIKRFPDIGR